MVSFRWRGVGLVDLLRAVIIVAAVAQRQPTHRLALWMALFALLIVLGDWVETRQLAEQSTSSRRVEVAFGVLTLSIVGTWYLLATRPPSALPAYFALLAGIFFLQAIRDAVVLDLSPVTLLTRGYVNLVAVYLVLGVAADAVDRLQVALVGVGALVYLVRKGFRWSGVILAQLDLRTDS